MGIYDREYYQEKAPGFSFGSRMMVTNLVIINVVIYFVDIFFFKREIISNGQIYEEYLLSNFLSLKSDQFHIWELLTYGFAHSPTRIIHILGNMFVLWFFGRDLEYVYGKQKFLFFYLTAIIVAGFIGGYAEAAISGAPIRMLGASGGVAAVLIAYICNYPRRTLLLWGILPMPAWVLGVLFLLWDFSGSFDSNSQVAHTAHLAGAAYGFIFFRTRWSLGSLVPKQLSWKSLQPRPKVRLHDPEADENLRDEVDRILEKIGREGESSLTRKERRTLEAASKRYQQRNRY